MIDKNKFYNEKDFLNENKKEIIWNKISNEINAGTKRNFHFEWRSFLIGAAAAVFLLFASIGIKTVIENQIFHSEPEYVKLDRSIREAANKFEKFIPAGREIEYGSVAVDDFISSRKEKLENVNYGITELQKDLGGVRYSQIKYRKLRELYLMKLNIIEEIIKMEEQIK